MKVYTVICQVQAAIAQTGISKDRTNKQGEGYKFRGIDDVYNALSPLLAKYGLCILPRMLTRECVIRQSAKGGNLYFVTVEAEFDFVSAEDGSKHTIRTFGEAMDSGDKATNKAMSAAYKYAAFQAFAIPTEGDNDSENTPESFGKALSAQEVMDWIAAIESSANEEELKKNYIGSIHQSKDDPVAQKKFIEAKDKKKAQLK